MKRNARNEGKASKTRIDVASDSKWSGLSERSLFKPVRFAYLRERFLPIVKYEGKKKIKKGMKDKKKEYKTNSYEFDLVSFLYEKKICSGINVRKPESPNRSIRL